MDLEVLVFGTFGTADLRFATFAFTMQFLPFEFHLHNCTCLYSHMHTFGVFGCSATFCLYLFYTKMIKQQYAAYAVYCLELCANSEVNGQNLLWERIMHFLLSCKQLNG